MRIKVRNSSVSQMIDIFESLSAFNDDQISQKIDRLLDHPDYQMEFERYGKMICQSDFKNFLLHLYDYSEDMISKKHLKMRLPYFKRLKSNIQYYRDKLYLLNIPDHVLLKQAKIASNGLPQDIHIDEVHFVFTIGIGASFGYVHNHQTHFDFLQLVDEKTEDEFYATLAHEVHHVGFNHLIKPDIMNQLPLDQLLFLIFSGEGLAVKYCNNAQGYLSKSIYSGAKNIGLDEKSWNYLNAQFEVNFDYFIETLDKIKNGTYSYELLQKDLNEFWMNPYSNALNKHDEPDLKQTRLYSFGNDIWGVIHDAFGKDRVYNTLSNLGSFIETFNASVESLGFSKYKIIC